MMACVSPALMVRATPDRISFFASSVVTETCRPLISSVAISVAFSLMGKSVLGVGDVHMDLTVANLDGEHGDRLGGRRRGRGTGAQVETGPVQPALDALRRQLALRQRQLGGRALVAQLLHRVSL